MDNLPKDPSNPNNGNNNNPPQPFGSGFNPHTNPIDPNNPYSFPNTPNLPNIPESSAENITHSEVAQHEQRDSHGRFVSEHEQPVPSYPQNPPTIPNPPIPPNTPNSPNTPAASNFSRPIVEIDPKQDSKDPDPPIFTIRNPVTYIKRWWNKILAKEGIDFKLGFKIRPITAVLIASIIISGGVSSGVTALILKTFWPTSSPILHRQIIQQGTIQKTSSGGFYLTSSGSSMWKLKPKNLNINFNDQVGKSVTVTGNMTKEANLIEVSEIILSN